MMKTLVAAVCVLFGCAAGAADQQPTRVNDKPMTKAEARFHALDTNSDSRLSPEEFQADATSQTEFTKLDKDADGYLNIVEFTARPIPHAKTPGTR